MTAVALPQAFEDWARTEVAAGHADSVEAFASKVLSRHMAGVAKLRASLDEAEAEADREGWIDSEIVFAELAALFADEA